MLSTESTEASSKIYVRTTLILGMFLRSFVLDTSVCTFT